MSTTSYFCTECDAIFKIKHDLDKYYEVMFCPFCGGGIDDEKEEDEDDTY
jgi:DNA-directed RNA polymerase subunit RPC12/RpoP